MEEIHRLAYDDRLGRVQTNLHMVIRELGALGDLCNEGEVDPERIRARFEGAVLIFTTEVRSVHDLLHRPPKVPSTEAFEGL